MLFVDVRGSTSLAEKMNDAEFSRLMNRFYEATINVLVQADAFIDKLVGDEVTACSSLASQVMSMPNGQWKPDRNS